MMKTFNYAPASPIKDNITMLAISVGMVVVPFVYPFGIRIGSTRILGPTGTAIVFIIGGLILLAVTLNKIRLARALAANGGKIVVDEECVTYPIVKKGTKSDKTFKISDIKHLEHDDEEGELEIFLIDGTQITVYAEFFDSCEQYEEFFALLKK